MASVCEFEVTPILPCGEAPRREFDEDVLKGLLGKSIWFAYRDPRLDVLIVKQEVTGVDLNRKGEIEVGAPGLRYSGVVSCDNYLGLASELDGSGARQEYCRRQLDLLNSQVKYWESELAREVD